MCELAKWRRAGECRVRLLLAGAVPLRTRRLDASASGAIYQRYGFNNTFVRYGTLIRAAYVAASLDGPAESAELFV